MSIGGHKQQGLLQESSLIPYYGVTNTTHLTLILPRMAGMSGCVGQNQVQIGKGQIPAEREPVPTQVGAKSLVPNHEGTGSPEEGEGEGIGPKESSLSFPSFPLRDIIPQDLATPLGYGEGHKKRVRR